MDLKKFESCSFKGEIRNAVKMAEAIRSDKENPSEYTFQQLVKDKFELGLESFYEQLGIDPSTDTISNIYSLPDDDIRWLVPEIFRDALRLGYRKAPIWPNITVSEENSPGLSQIMPHINMSDAAPRRVGEAETIPVGTISYGQKKFTIYKIGRGIKISYEVLNYVSLNVVSLFLQDFGVKLGHAMDTLAIDCLINGEQTNGSESAPVIGIANANSPTYKDMLKIWIRAARIGRTLGTIIGGEDAALATLDFSEFKNRNYGTPDKNLALKTPVPSTVNYFIHGNVPSKQEIFVDPSASIIKFNAQPIMVESERIVSNQTEAFYASLTTGFAKMFRDAAVIMDSSKTFVANPFPSYMDVDPFENVPIL
jgi:hypothetical protein